MKKKIKSSMSATEALDMYFLENRARLLDIAAFLDRIDRYPSSSKAHSDFRYTAFIQALRKMIDSDSRTSSIQQIFSDMSSEPLDRVEDQKAYGAWKEHTHENY